MPRLVVIRPAETDYHLEGRLLGRCDVDLNDTGRIQAEELVDRLAHWEFASVAVSPLKRAIATAMPLCEFENVILHPVAGFHAEDLGDWEGQERRVLELGDGSRYHQWLTDPDFRAPGGECMREIYGRAYSDLAHIVQQAEPGQTLGFVLPLALIRVFCCAALDLSIESSCRFDLRPGGFAVFERMYLGGPYQLIGWNQPTALDLEVHQEFFEEELPNV